MWVAPIFSANAKQLILPLTRSVFGGLDDIQVLVILLEYHEKVDLFH
jgi:hypothetical protein